MDTSQNNQSSMVFNFTNGEIENDPDITVSSAESFMISDFDDLMATIPEEFVNAHNISLYFYSSYSYRIWILDSRLKRQGHLISQPVRGEIMQTLLLNQQRMVRVEIPIIDGQQQHPKK